VNYFSDMHAAHTHAGDGSLSVKQVEMLRKVFFETQNYFEFENILAAP